MLQEEVVTLRSKTTEQQVEITSWTTGVLVFLVALWALFGPKLGRLHLTEGSAACLFGLLCGCMLLAGQHYIAQQAVVKRLLTFSAASFFTYLLPPVIFYAGLSIEKQLFFSNLGSILALGVLGTAVTALVLAALLAAGFAGLKLLRIQDCLALGAIFSATDSVATLQVLNPERQPILFSLVFGEGVINDATSVVLLGAVSIIFPTGSAAAESTGGWDTLSGITVTFMYLFITSMVLGAATGMGISCLVVRFAAHGPHHEVALIGLLSYLAYLAAEVLGLSGILSLFCCGLTVSQFALDNISPLGRSTTLNAFHTMSYICEGIIFIYLGMDALDPAKWHAAHPGEAASLCGALLLLLLLARAASVVPITALHNWLHPAKLSSTDIVIIWWSGLMRGAVSVALAYYYFDIGSPSGSSGDRHHSTLIVATLVVVLFSVLTMGAATQPLMQFLMSTPDLSLMDKLLLGTRNLKTKARDWSHWVSSLCGGRKGRSSGSGSAGGGGSGGGSDKDWPARQGWFKWAGYQSLHAAESDELKADDDVHSDDQAGDAAAGTGPRADVELGAVRHGNGHSRGGAGNGDAGTAAGAAHRIAVVGEVVKEAGGVRSVTAGGSEWGSRGGAQAAAAASGETSRRATANTMPGRRNASTGADGGPGSRVGTPGSAEAVPGRALRGVSLDKPVSPPQGAVQGKPASK